MCPISFNIYGIKLNEVHFSSRTVIIHFLDKSYQEINLTKNTVRFAQVPFNIILTYLIVFTFTMRLKSANYKSQ